MSAVLETLVEGTPGALEQVGVFLGNTVGARGESLTTDVNAARRRSLDGWSGSAADAFGATVGTASSAVTSYADEARELARSVAALGRELASVQGTMSEARYTASSAGLVVSGTQISSPPDLASGDAPLDDEAAVDAHNAKVATWNRLVDGVGDAHERWNAALRTFAAVWEDAGSNLVGLTSDLVTASVTAGALANTAFRLKSTMVVNQDRLLAAQRNLADAIKDGKVVLPKDDVYALMDDASKAKSAIAGADDALKSGLRVGSKLSRGLLVLGIAGTGYGIYDDIQQGESVTQAVVSNGGGFLAGMGAGAATGAIVGSFIAPPAGTIVGAALGTVIGGAVSIFASGAIDHLFEDASAGFVDTIEAGWNELADTGEAIGDLASGAWNAVFG